MFRRHRAIFLVLALLWQALAMLLPAQVHARADLIAHAVGHWQDADHHHHADASLHVDEHEDQAVHDHSHEGVQPSAILPSAGVFAADVPRSGLLTLIAREPPSVFLRAPLRPPQALA